MTKAVYKNDSKEFYKFGKFHNFVGNVRQIYIFSGVFTAVGLLSVVNSFFNGYEYAVAALIFFALAVLMPLVNLWKLNSKIKNSIKSNENYFKTSSIYMFEKNHIKIQIDVDGKNEDHRLKYTDFLKAYRTKTNFYLYLNNSSALIIVNSGIVQGNADSLSGLLTRHLGKRFKSKVKNRRGNHGEKRNSK